MYNTKPNQSLNRSFPSYYEDEVAQARQYNLNNIDYEDDDVKTKANNLAKRWAFPSGQFVIDEAMCGNKMAQVALAKDPSKQSIAEKLQVQYLQDRIGTRAVNLAVGEMPLEHSADSSRKTKSVDVVIDNDVLATLKVLTDKGSSQTRSIEECKEFLRIAEDLGKTGIVIIDDISDKYTMSDEFKGFEDKVFTVEEAATYYNNNKPKGVI